MSTISNEVFDELKRFVKEKNIVMQDGLVTGDLTPQEVLHLGYTLIAWVLEPEDESIFTQVDGD